MPAHRAQPVTLGRCIAPIATHQAAAVTINRHIDHVVQQPALRRVEQLVVLPRRQIYDVALLHRRQNIAAQNLARAVDNIVELLAILMFVVVRLLAPLHRVHSEYPQLLQRPVLRRLPGAVPARRPGLQATPDDRAVMGDNRLRLAPVHYCWHGSGSRLSIGSPRTHYGQSSAGSSSVICRMRGRSLSTNDR